MAKIVSRKLLEADAIVAFRDEYSRERRSRCERYGVAIELPSDRSDNFAEELVRKMREAAIVAVDQGVMDLEVVMPTDMQRADGECRIHIRGWVRKD